MAEREGFEPPELSLNGFQDRRLKPLGHLSGLILRSTVPTHNRSRGPRCYSLRTAHIGPQCFWYDNTTVGLLTVLQDRDDRPPHGKTGTIQRMNKLGLFSALGLVPYVPP